MSEETDASLESLRTADGTVVDVIPRLLGDRRRVRDGAGYWRHGDASENARRTRAELKDEIDFDRR